MKFIKQNKKYPHTAGGFTLVELVVGVGLFVTVALISSSAFLGVVSSNRKTLAIRTAMDNLNFAMENMSRQMKTGSSYYCATDPISGTAPAGVHDCATGGKYITLEGQKGDPSNPNDQVVYRQGDSSLANCPSVKQICISTDSGNTFSALTAPDLSVDTLLFWVYDTDPSTKKQPRIVITLVGSAGIGITQSTFDIQTTVSQRAPNFP